MGSVVKRMIGAAGVIKSKRGEGIIEDVERFLESGNDGRQSAFRRNGGPELIPDVVREGAKLPYRYRELGLKNPFKHLFRLLNVIDGQHALVSRIWVFVQSSKVSVDGWLITRGDTRIGMQRGINHGNVVSDRRLRGFSGTGGLGRGSIVISGRGIRHSGIVVSSRGWGWPVCLSMWDLNTIKDFSWST